MGVQVNGDLLRCLLPAACGSSAGWNAMSWSQRYVAAAHTSMHQLAAALGERELALKHSRLALAWNLLLQGPEAPDTLRSREALETLQSEESDA